MTAPVTPVPAPGDARRFAGWTVGSVGLFLRHADAQRFLDAVRAAGFDSEIVESWEPVSLSRSGIQVFTGGVSIVGTLLEVKGRTFDVDQLTEALQLAATITAAVARMQGPARV